ncbi:MAG: hypothetical protein WBA89_23780 [Microcoleus sp.]|uniref:hypothetical protein n=1 Tax=Microcoleus sp. TaxID=44472 RepID=UPI003C71592C
MIELYYEFCLRRDRQINVKISYLFESWSFGFEMAIDSKSLQIPKYRSKIPNPKSTIA